MSNRLQYESSPYLLQHKDNPVDWYPWGKEAFEQAKAQDKPIFLSIGYSTCHWCHVLAHESFENKEIATLLNRYFISIKVDKEERPDIDSVYMAVCQAFTGSGGWPTSIFMTPDQKPFYAGTYFPMIGFKRLLLAIQEKWEQDRSVLLEQSEDLLKELKASGGGVGIADEELIHLAVEQYKHQFDPQYGGFGHAPKFPTPHNLLFLLAYYRRFKDRECLQMAEQTLMQMYRGGLFDHIGFGFCRYSTDRRFLVPHFEKMLYDNALLILAYADLYSTTNKSIYLNIAEKTADYILREMTAAEGGFYSAQDADSEGEEGKYYLFTPGEILKILGKERGEAFNRQYDIRNDGNFEGKNIPNLLNGEPTAEFDSSFGILQKYRKERYSLHLDDKILTAWNGLMIAAMCELYLASGKDRYLEAARKADDFVRENLSDKDILFVSYRGGRRGAKGFLEDYACYIFALLALYKATLDSEYIQRAELFCHKVSAEFEDPAGGFYLYGHSGEELILRPKETYDGAIPSGNSIMAYNLVRLAEITASKNYSLTASRQLDFLAGEASAYPAGYGMFLTALLDHIEPPIKITVVSDGKTTKSRLLSPLPPNAIVIFLDGPTQEYPIKNGKTTYYVCKGKSCLPPVNEMPRENP